MQTNVLVVMGVSGAGKSTVATLLSQQLGWDLEEGDDLHPATNVEKMASGRPLDDDDRRPWLDNVRAWIDAEFEAGRSGVISCSALKRAYRDRLRRPGVRFVYLQVERTELEHRLATRAGHYMPASLLDSQLDALEPPDGEPDVITIADGDAEQALATVIAAL